MLINTLRALVNNTFKKVFMKKKNFKKNNILTAFFHFL